MSARKIVHYLPDGLDRVYEVFQGGVVRIVYYEPQGEGDAHYCDVDYSDGSRTRVFRPDVVIFAKEVEA